MQPPNPYGQGFPPEGLPPGGLPPGGGDLPPGAGYPAAPYGYPPPRRTNGMAIAAMVVSLASLFTCPLVGAVGIYLGYKGREEINTRGEEGEGFATAGIVVGWVALGLTLLYVCLFAGVFGVSFLPLFFV